MNAFGVGFPCAMACQSSPVFRTHRGMAMLVNAVPLSDTIVPGFPCSVMAPSSARVIRRPDRDVSAIRARLSRV